MNQLTQSRKIFSSLCLGIAMTLSSTVTIGADDRPNIVLILADDLGYSDLGCTGSDLYQTPNIDAFARDSVKFERAYTSPTCSPSRAAIMSGKTPARLGIVGHGGLRSMEGGGDFLVSEEYTVAEALRDAGYSTCHIGKWHVGTKSVTGPHEQGFDEVIASNDFCCPGSYFYPFRDKRKTGKAAERSAVPDLEDRHPGDHLTKCLGEEAVDYLERQKASDKPFFLNLWYYAVHTPIEAQRDKVAKYKSLIDPDSHQRNPSYAGLVEHLDDSVGSVLRAIDNKGFRDNTIVIFFSDNGGEIRKGVTSNFPLRSGKTSLYEGGIRVPLLVRWPGVTRAGETCQEAVVGHDLYPTILRMSDVKGHADQNANMDGVDITPLLRDPSASLPTRAMHWLRYGELIHYPTYKNDREFGPCAAIRKGPWKMVERYPTPHGLEHRFELFNLHEDPYEAHNLAREEPAKLEELRRDLTAWQTEIEIPKYEDLAYPAFEKLK
ncbi:arylsulfatase A-like enzyme [Rhodopirellula rubra]|uniref:Arylsulfatase A-like enzyme n=1 Tax=Aporhodopirellula rubra TaxID=980271 RepID=A0A7W5DU88_9BACT|nr:sulfatase [Aporhodopirellula rubra]MBB3204641.1 arylsulfatase A-like enzyme [Aporhodopirellula rubra]